MNPTEFYDKGILLIKEAVALDSDDKPEEAISKYSTGIEYLINFIRCEPRAAYPGVGAAP